MDRTVILKNLIAGTFSALCDTDFNERLCQLRATEIWSSEAFCHARLGAVFNFAECSFILSSVVAVQDQKLYKDLRILHTVVF